MKSVIRGGRVVDPTRRRADFADVVIDGDTIVDLARPGTAVAERAVERPAN